MPGCSMTPAAVSMWLGGFLFWGGLIAFGVWAVRRVGARRGGGAERILEERLARGEIDAEEYLARRSVLGGRVFEGHPAAR